jgi:hypothetical protein
MKSLELVKQHGRLIALFKKTATVTGGDLEAQAHWAKYLCVLSAGFLENALCEVYTRYCASCSSPKVARFTAKALSRVQNPKTGTFLDITESFSDLWHSQLEAFVEDDGRKDAINSIMSNRHLIAHGKDTTISLVRVREYLQKSVEVVEFLEQQCGIN